MQISSSGATGYAAPSSQAGSGAPPAAAKKPKADTAVADFMALANMTPAQKMRAAILGSMKLTEDQLKAMDAKERAKIEEKIKKLIQQKIEQSVEKQTGVVVDLKA